MLTTLELVCRGFGYQGGTIHQMRQRFSVATMQEMDRVCGLLSDNLRNLSDPQTALEFMTARREAVRLHDVAALHFANQKGGV